MEAVEEADLGEPEPVADPVRVGDSLVYTLLVNNNGPFANDTVNVTDTIPAGVNVISITPRLAS